MTGNALSCKTNLESAMSRHGGDREISDFSRSVNVCTFDNIIINMGNTLLYNMKRIIPFKIKLIGFLHILFGVILLINGIYLLVMVDAGNYNEYSEEKLLTIKNITISLFLTVSIVSILFILIGWRLWYAKRWTRYFTVILPVTYFFLDLILFPPSGISRMGIVLIIVYSMIPSYLFFNKGAKEAFRRYTKRDFFDF